MGPSVVAPKLKGPLKFSQADILGARMDLQRILRVSSVLGRSWSQRKLGNESEISERIARKCALKVWMDRLEALLWWTCGGTRCNLQFHLSSMASL